MPPAHAEPAVVDHRLLRRTEPTARMAPSGGLMMAENSSTSNMPRLEIEKVAPDISCARSLRWRARSARSRASTAICASGLASQSRSTGVMSPSSSATAMPMWARWKTRIDSPWNEALTPGCCSSASAHARMHEVVDRDLGLALERVQLLAQRPCRDPSRLPR